MVWFIKELSAMVVRVAKTILSFYPGEIFSERDTNIII